MTDDPSEEKTADVTGPACPAKVRRQSASLPQHICGDASQSFAVQSFEAVSTRLPSGENTAEQTASECPEKVCLQAPEEELHSLAVPSSDAVRTSSLRGSLPPCMQPTQVRYKAKQ